MYNMEKYRKRIVLFDLLRINLNINESFPLIPVYMVSLSEAKNFENIKSNKFYKRIINMQQLRLYCNCIDAYNLNGFGQKNEENELLESKITILQVLNKELGDAWELSSIWEHADSAFCKSIIGTLYYYGINRTADQERGEKLLIEAAYMGDSDALLWCLWKYPEKAREYMEKLVSLPESLANPEWLNPWKEHYNLWDVKEKQIVKHKIGF